MAATPGVSTSERFASHRIHITSSSSSEVKEGSRPGQFEVSSDSDGFLPLDMDVSGGAPAKPARSSAQVDHDEHLLLSTRPQQLHVSP